MRVTDHRDLTPDQARGLLRTAVTAEDVFGPRTGDRDDAQRTYRRLARLVHPDRCEAPGAAAAFTRLADLWASWSGAAPTGPVELSTRRHRYVLGTLAARGDLSNLYRADAQPLRTSPAPGPVVLKMPRDPRNNDLLTAEARTLTHLARETDPRHAAYLPRLVETFRHRDTGTGVDRQVNVLEELRGFHTLADVAAAYPAGVDARDVAWMWRRLLVALGVIHRAGVIHGAVLPEHVLIHPAEHGLVLADFAYATTGQPVPAIVPRYRDWYPAEVAAKTPPTAATDIAMATRCMTGLMGERAPRPLRAFAAGCTLTSQRARPDDAWALLSELDDLLERLYGPRRFRPFTMPAPAGPIT